MARITFAHMWKLVTKNYLTYFGKYQTIFTPELMIAIFWEENLFDNTTQHGGGPAVGFGQVEKPEIPKVNAWFGTTFDKDGSDVLHNEAQGVQLAGLTLARLYEIQVKQGNLNNPRDVALVNYAGYPSNQNVPPKWKNCETELLKVGLRPVPITFLSIADVKSIKKALTFARGCDEWNFFPTFPTPVGRWKVKVGVWNWVYKFYEDHTADWRDTVHPETPKGRGQWFQDHKVMRIEWETGSVEAWDLPLRRDKQTGTLIGQGKIITAHKVA
jgi:hypothetical protein